MHDEIGYRTPRDLTQIWQGSLTWGPSDRAVLPPTVFEVYPECHPGHWSFFFIPLRRHPKPSTVNARKDKLWLRYGVMGGMEDRICTISNVYVITRTPEAECQNCF